MFAFCKRWESHYIDRRIKSGIWKIIFSDEYPREMHCTKSENRFRHLYQGAARVQLYGDKVELQRAKVPLWRTNVVLWWDNINIAYGNIDKSYGKCIFVHYI